MIYLRDVYGRHLGWYGKETYEKDLWKRDLWKGPIFANKTCSRDLCIEKRPITGTNVWKRDLLRDLCMQKRPLQGAYVCKRYLFKGFTKPLCMQKIPIKGVCVCQRDLLTGLIMYARDVYGSHLGWYGYGKETYSRDLCMQNRPIQETYECKIDPSKGRMGWSSQMTNIFENICKRDVFQRRMR